MKYRPVIIAAITAIVCVGATPADAPRSGLAQSAQRRYDADVKQAKADYATAIKDAQGRYLNGLDLALNKAMDQGVSQVDEVTRIVAAKKVFVAGMKDANPLNDPIANTWSLNYSNGINRIYKITPEGIVEFPEAKTSARLVRDGSAYKVSWPDGKIERFTFSGSRLFVEHYMTPKHFSSGVIDYWASSNP